jgi:hypothetical protein
MFDWWYYVWVRYENNALFEFYISYFCRSGNLAEFNSYELLKNLEEHVSFD